MILFLTENLFTFGWQTLEPLKKKSPCRPQTVTKLENVVRVRAFIEQSPKCSALKHAVVLELSDNSVRRILLRDLRMHPYKMMVTLV
ncbi:DUF4817 domain-containing protein [Trichonephila clavata]|uniref:DUF4817 domain-containing protein n=1 Tax=Trichonephila clavata TaxID=2740835 RepID=A0A8X6JX07_TRICU|nr:DUF4817 domain-containing protein [Trichonephila clavata]